MEDTIYIGIMPLHDGTFRTVMIDTVTEKYMVSSVIHKNAEEAKQAAILLSSNTPQEIVRLFKAEIENRRARHRRRSARNCRWSRRGHSGGAHLQLRSQANL